MCVYVQLLLRLGRVLLWSALVRNDGPLCTLERMFQYGRGIPRVRGV